MSSKAKYKKLLTSNKTSEKYQKIVVYKILEFYALFAVETKKAAKARKKPVILF